jgi:hypothetical protein
MGAQGGRRKGFGDDAWARGKFVAERRRAEHIPVGVLSI